VGGSVAGTDQITILAYDGQTFGSQTATITTKVNQAPVVTTYNQTVNSGASVTPSFSVSDPDGDSITQYYFSDNNTSSTSGYFTLNGVKQTSAFFATPAQLSTVRFVGGSTAGTDSVTIYASDGQTWGYQNSTITTQKVNQAPVVSASDQTVRRNQSIQPSFSVTDADGDKITRYYFYDSNSSSTSGYFTVNGIKQADGGFYVDADKLGTVSFVGGSTASSDTLYTQAYDGTAWSNWKDYKIQTQAGSNPVVTASDQTVNANESMKPFFSVTDADGDKITRYAFLDGNSSTTSGYFTVDGVKQAAGQTFYVDADKLNTVAFVGGTVAGVDAVSIAASDGVEGWSNQKQFNISTKSAVADWFEQNIKDLAIRSLARSRFQDGLLDRQDMIDIFTNAKDGGVVDADEFADLKTLTSNTSYIKMREDVQVLSTKISQGNPANNSYQGSALGNLQAGSSAFQLEKLINKHFLGIDRPFFVGDKFTCSNGTVINMSYQQAQGNLFQGINYEDVKQGLAGDCYFLASLAAVALKTPNVIQEMFTDNRDGTYTVRFFNNGQADYVTVDRYLPTYKNAFAFANYGGKYDDSNNELWVALAEKAYAQINEAGWLGRPTTKEGINLNGLNTYQAIDRGWTNEATAQISNKIGNDYSIQSSFFWPSLSPNEVVEAFTSGKLISFGSFGPDQTKYSPVASGHAYTMVGYNQATEQFKLFNPWGLQGGKPTDDTFKPGILEMTWNQIQTYFRELTVNA
ncbi:MAG: C2 family cysteine protease, partial [Microcoleus sp.]